MKVAPRGAIWLLRHACPGRDSEALTGDLIERFGEGRSRAWFWRQALAAIAVGAGSEPRRRWPELCYAIAGTFVSVFQVRALLGVRTMVGWWMLPWPFSMLLFDGVQIAMPVTAVLPVLAVGLLWTPGFQWRSLVRTWTLSIVLLTACLYMLGEFAPLRVLGLPLGFGSLLVGAWVGCRREITRRGAPRQAARGTRAARG